MGHTCITKRIRMQADGGYKKKPRRKNVPCKTDMENVVDRTRMTGQSEGDVFCGKILTYL